MGVSPSTKPSLSNKNFSNLSNKRIYWADSR
jgi:hypothetical protein